MEKTICALAALLLITASFANETLREQGAFGMPQKEATVLCDTPDLKVSVCNTVEYLMVQAIVWKDNDNAEGTTSGEERKIGDYSVLLLDVDSDGKETPQVDKQYHLNPWPEMPGLHYVDVLGPGATSTLKNGSKGRGATRYVVVEGKKVRVDTYLIPRTEILAAGDKIRFALFVYSPSPKMMLSSTGFKNGGKDFHAFNIPMQEYHAYKFRKGGSIKAESVPDEKAEK